jgi:hypothetical protein
MAKPTGKPNGRPKKIIDYQLVEDLSQIQCTQEEISQILDISSRTLQKDEEFLRIYKKGIESGRMSLRRMQYKSAMNGNVTMQIWLGKQYLNQMDKMVVDNNAELIEAAADTLIKVRKVAEAEDDDV